MRQTLPLIKPERPRVGTVWKKSWRDRRVMLSSRARAGTVTRVTGDEIVITQASGESRNYPLIRFDRTKPEHHSRQRPAVKEGQRVDAGQMIADGAAIDNGELAWVVISSLPSFPGGGKIRGCHHYPGRFSERPQTEPHRN